jgi:NhaP-type Na+/H+ and K+/H+ antiporter
MELLFIPIFFLLLLTLVILGFLLSNWLNVPIVLFFIGIGIFFSKMSYNGESIFYLPDPLFISISIFALSILIFYSFSKIRFNQFDTLTKKAMRLSALIIFLNLAIISTFLFFLFHLNLIFSVIFALLISATSFDITFPEFQKKHNRVTRLLEAESILSTPLISIISIVILAAALDWPVSISSGQYVHLFLDANLYSDSSIIVGIFSVLKVFFISAAVGLFIALVVINIMRKKHLRMTSPAFLMAAILISYIAAELFSANGVVAVAFFGVIYGHSLIKEKNYISSIFSGSARASFVLGFLLIATMFEITNRDRLSGSLFVSSLLIFGLVIIVRLASVFICFSKKDYSFKEKIFISLNVSYGISAITVLFALIIFLSQLNIFTGSFLQDEKTFFISLVILTVIYSLIISTIILKKYSYFFNLNGLDSHVFFDLVKNKNKGAKK